MEVVSKSLPGVLRESDLSPETVVFIYFWENANVPENWTKAVNLVPRGKRNVHRLTTHSLQGPGGEDLSGMRASAASLARTSRAKGFSRERKEQDHGRRSCLLQEEATTCPSIRPACVSRPSHQAWH